MTINSFVSNHIKSKIRTGNLVNVWERANRKGQ